MSEDIEMVEVEFEMSEETVEKALQNSSYEEIDELVRELYRQVALYGEVVEDVN